MTFWHSDDEIERHVKLDDLSLKTLIALIERLRQTETSSQFLSREIEMDQAYFWADTELKEAVSDERPPEALAELGEVREAVLRAHDFVGESNAHAAIEELNRVIEHKIGLG